MNRSRSKYGRLLLVICLHAVGLLFFCRGYLLTRIELREHSRCDDPVPSLRAKASGGCWTSAVYDRLVVIVIDGLRFDSVVDEDCQRSGDKPLHVAGLPRLMNLLHSGDADSAVVYKFIADPPTGTMQRLKGIFTGSLPTLVDVSESFSGKTVKEDNFLARMKERGKKLIFAGDDTWDVLFHESLDVSMPYDSFNVEDLHTVDNAVRTEFYPLVLKSPESWDFAAGHYLGMDHAGHMFTVDSTEVSKKLQQMDAEITGFLEELARLPALQEDRTLCLVFGDHGMTLSGNHGGGSREEIESALLGIDLQKLRQNLQLSTRTSKASCKENLTVLQMNQIDLAVSLALLFDVPVPFGSLGKASAELLQLQGETDLREYLQINAWQVHRYLNTYADAAKGNFRKRIESLNSLYAKAVNAEDAAKAYSRYLDAAVAFARLHWTQFDDVSIVFGICILAGSLLMQSCTLGQPWKDRSLTSAFFVVAPLLHGLLYFSNSFIEREAEVVCSIVSALALLLARQCLLKIQKETWPQCHIWICLLAIFVANTVLASIGTVYHSAVAQEKKQKQYSGLHLMGYLFVPLLAATLYRTDQLLSKGEDCGVGRTFNWGSCQFLLFVFQLGVVMLHWMTEDLWLTVLFDPDFLAHVVYTNAALHAAFLLALSAKDRRSYASRQRTLLSLCLSVLPAYLLLSKKIGCLVVTTSIWELFAFHRLIRQSCPDSTSQTRGLCFGIVGHYTALQIFFFTEHYCEFSGLHFSAAFAGLAEFHYRASGTLLALDTFCAFILLPMLLAIVSEKEEGHHALMSYSTVRSYALLQSMISANLMRRHLWSIRTFAPKFVFEMSFLLVTDLCVLLTLKAI